MSCMSFPLCLILCCLTLPAAWGTVRHFSRCNSTLSQTYFVFARSNLACEGQFAACKCTRRRPEQKYRLQVTLTTPDAATCTNASNGTGGTVFFFHGFGGKFVLSARNYMVYAELLARAGYTVVEYDIEQGAGPLEVVPDIVEVKFLHRVYESLRSGRAAGSAALRSIDLGSVFLAGHSRGGKLAALHFASGMIPNTRGAFLIDPVDCPCFAPESECYPSARQALKEAGRAIAAVGSTIRGCCNPNSGEPAACVIFGKPCIGYGPEDLVKAAGSGSELDLVSAGHMQFAQLGGIELLVANDLCGHNSSVSNEQVGAEVGDLMLAWFAKEGRGGGDPVQL